MNTTYTYHNGEPLTLACNPDAFISRAKQDVLQVNGFKILRQLSPHSFRIAVNAGEGRAEQIRKASILGPAFGDYLIPDLHERGGDATELLVTDRVIVRFRKPMSRGELSRFERQYGVAVMRPYSGHSRRDFLVHSPKGEPVDLVRVLSEHDARVAIVEHDVNHRLSEHQITLPQNEDYPTFWYLRDVDDVDTPPAGSAHCENAWSRLDSFGDPSVVIGVTDGAFQLQHPDLLSGKVVGWAYIENCKLFTSEDKNADPSKLASGSERLISHGTSCAALAAAPATGAHGIGAAPGCSLYLMKFPNDGTTPVVSNSDLQLAVSHLRDKVDIVTSSWGDTAPRSTWDPLTIATVAEAATRGGRRKGKGIIFIWSAGNSDRPLARRFKSEVLVPYDRIEDKDEVSNFKRATFFSNELVGTPNVLHIAASTSSGRRAHFSNYGSGIDLAAPSGNGTILGCFVPGDGGRSVMTSVFKNGEATVDSFDGTSASAPLVAGIAALVISAKSDLTAADTISILKRTAEREQLDLTPYPAVNCPHIKAGVDVSPVEPFNDGRFKNPEHPDGSRSDWFGFGRVDAHAAVLEATKQLVAFEANIGVQDPQLSPPAQ